MSRFEWPVSTEEQDRAKPIEFEIIDSDGSLPNDAHGHSARSSSDIASSGRAHTIDKAVNRSGVDRQVVGSDINASQVDAASVSKILMESFSEATTREIKRSIASTVSTLIDSVQTLHLADAKRVEPIWRCVGDLFIHAQNHLAAVLAIIASSTSSNEMSVTHRIGAYSANLSLLGLVMSTMQKHEPRVSLQIGMAGLFHDSSLLLNQEWFSSSQSAGHENLRRRYRRHPIESADMLNGLPGIPREVLTMIMETHEQADGSGYPRGLTLGKVRQGSELLNAADAYLSLTQPVQGTRYLPSDAIGFLCLQTSAGKFCKEAVQLLTKSLSMYPIGSLIELDDRSQAVVVRGNMDQPMRPVGRLLHRIHEEHDLRTSQRVVTKPLIPVSFDAQRIPKSRFDELLWRNDREHLIKSI